MNCYIEDRMSNQDEIAKYLEKHRCPLCDSIVDNPIVEDKDKDIDNNDKDRKQIDGGSIIN